MMTNRLAAFALGGLALALAQPAFATDEMIDVPTKRGAVEKMLLIEPSGQPSAALVMFVGSGGEIGFAQGWPEGKRGGNFLFRTADQFARQGFLVAVLDAPSDWSTLWNRRTGRDHAGDVADAIAALRQRAPVPVWLVGTSMGTLSAANGAARLGPDGPNGIVLTSSVTQTSRNSAETALSVALEDIAVPVLVVHHDNDACAASPVSGAKRIVEHLDHAPDHALMTFSGGNSPRSGPCEPFAPHGYLGIEDSVVAAISAWIKERTPKSSD